MLFVLRPQSISMMKDGVGLWNPCFQSVMWISLAKESSSSVYGEIVNSVCLYCIRLYLCVFVAAELCRRECFLPCYSLCVCVEDCSTTCGRLNQAKVKQKAC